MEKIYREYFIYYQVELFHIWIDSSLSIGGAHKRNVKLYVANALLFDSEPTIIIYAIINEYSWDRLLWYT